jgi:hypothetical protein
MELMITKNKNREDALRATEIILQQYELGPNTGQKGIG